MEATPSKPFRKATPDLVFSDWKMPSAGGEEVLRYMRDERRLAFIPIIAITAFGSSHTAIEAIRLGAYDFVTNPFDLEEICLTAKRALEHSSLNSELMHLRAGWGQRCHCERKDDWLQRSHARCVQDHRKSCRNRGDGFDPRRVWHREGIDVRELENMIEHAVLMARGRVIMPSHFPREVES